MSYRHWILSAYITILLTLRGYVCGDSDDAHYVLLENRELAGSSQLIKSISVPRKTFCGIHCNILETCSHFTISTSDDYSCDLYSSIDRGNMPSVSGRNSYLRVNPSGTFSVDFLSILGTETASADGIVLWLSSAGDTNNNLDIYDVTSVHRCYQICLLNTDGNCWAFSYVASADRCIVPDNDGNGMTYDRRAALVQQSVSGATYYLYNQATVESFVGDAALGSDDYLLFADSVYYTGGSVDDMTNNLRIRVDTMQECYRICLLTNSDNCVMFSYDSTNTMCYVPHNDGSQTSVTDYTSTSSSVYDTYFVTDIESGDAFDSNHWSTHSNLKILDGQNEHANDYSYSGVSSVDVCHFLCTSTVSTCQTFSFNPNDGACYIADANFHDDWTSVESISGCTAYFLKETGKWKLLTKHREYQGNVPDDSYTAGGNWHSHAYYNDMVFTNGYQAHTYLKAEIIDYWSSMTSKNKIRLEMYSSSGTFLKYIEYNADGSTATDWFASGRFESSSYSDLHSGVTHNYWSMGSSGRTFYISHNHGGCTSDSGWIEISSTVNSGCTAWDHTGTVPMFLYASGSNYINWSQSRAHFGVLIIKMSFS